jgi:hypothetical protein
MAEFIYEEDKDPFENHQKQEPQKNIKGSLNENILEILRKPPVDLTNLNEEK